MAHEIIMPALGMAQETGRLVAWLKNEGDAVSKGDPLMEVETDKSTMEVEAQKDGFLVNITAQANTDVPVGDVVA
ncbi:MAG: pyruvate dehydrogenase, partial [Alphaproteobacteria bacterium]|nr:pyruvate dehydrogenase [Alphaproteobacteria bacterium]